jgi:hypothetical protein
MLASLLFPYDNDAPSKIDGWLEALEKEKTILRYSADGQSYIQIVNWLDHQKIDKPSPSRIPVFENPREDSATPREDSALDQGEDRIGEEGSGMDGNAPAAPEPTTSQKRFQKPSLEEISRYCQERGNSVDPQRFLDYYESNGWKVGKNAMKDWRAAVRTWERNEGGKQHGRNNWIPTPERVIIPDFKNAGGKRTSQKS